MSSTMNWPSPGLGHAPSYQVSGIPYATGSIAVNATPVQVTFPYVTQWIQITHHTNADLRIGFSSNGVQGTNYFLLPGVNPSNGVSQSPILPIKCSSIYLLRDASTNLTASIVAGLTSIPTSELVGTGPSGVNWSGSTGVG